MKYLLIFAMTMLSGISSAVMVVDGEYSTVDYQMIPPPEPTPDSGQQPGKPK